MPLVSIIAIIIGAGLLLELPFIYYLLIKKKTMKYLSILVILFISSTAVYAQSDKELVESTITKSKIEGHIYFLADDQLKGRETLTVENKIAASYLANALRGYGVKPNPETGTYYQEVRLKKTSPPNRVTISLNDKEIKSKVVLKAQQMKFKGEALFLGYGLEDDYKGVDVSKRIVIVKGGDADSQGARAAFGFRKEKEELAKQNGALAIVELIKTDSDTWGFIQHHFNSDRLEVLSSENDNKSKRNGFGYLWVHDEYGTLALDFSKNTTVPIVFMMTGETNVHVNSQNVIGIVEGTDPNLKNEYIIYSAHYDHVGIGEADDTGDDIYNGARDNAVGTTTVLSMAENLAKYPTKRSALFILFTGEEKGLLGSKYYVENPVLPLEQMVYCFNSDNAGYNDTSLATIIGLNRTTASQNIKDAVSAFGLTAIDDPAPEQGLFDRSDNVNFAKKGIPSPTFSLGFSSFDGDVTKYYHQASDEADNLDYDYLVKFFKAYVLSGRKIANDPVTPTWIAGDKYEEAGKALYKN